MFRCQGKFQETRIVLSMQNIWNYRLTITIWWIRTGRQVWGIQALRWTAGQSVRNLVLCPILAGMVEKSACSPIVPNWLLWKTDVYIYRGNLTSGDSPIWMEARVTGQLSIKDKEVTPPRCLHWTYRINNAISSCTPSESHHYRLYWSLCLIKLPSSCTCYTLWRLALVVRIAAQNVTNRPW